MEKRSLTEATENAEGIITKLQRVWSLAEATE